MAYKPDVFFPKMFCAQHSSSYKLLMTSRADRLLVQFEGNISLLASADRVGKTRIELREPKVVYDAHIDWSLDRRPQGAEKCLLSIATSELAFARFK